MAARRTTPINGKRRHAMRSDTEERLEMTKPSAAARKAQREQEAAANADFYNDGPGARLVVETEGETVSETAGAAPDSSATDAAAAESALAMVPIRYSVTEDQLAKLREEGAKASFDSPEGYEHGRKLIATLRALSGAVERTRKIVKAPALTWGNRVDETAKALASQISDIRDPLQTLKDAEDAAREKRRRAAEDAEREAIRLAEQAKLDEQRKALEAQQRELAESQARIAEEQRLAREQELQRQAEERQQLEAQRRELAEAQAKLAEAQQAARAEAEQLATDRQAVALDRERVTLAGADLDRGSLPPVRAATAAIPIPPPLPTRDWVSGEGEAVAPLVVSDLDLLRSFAAEIRALDAPTVKSDTAGAIVEQVEFMLAEAIQALESYSENQGAQSAAE